MRLYEALIMLGLAVSGASSATGIVVLANVYRERVARVIDLCTLGLVAGWVLMAAGIYIYPI